MPAPKSKPSSSRSGASKPTSRTASSSKDSATKTDGRSGGATKTAAKASAAPPAKSVTDGVAGPREQPANRFLHPLDLVLLTRDRIQDTLDDFAERGRVTRDDANALVAELVRRGREQTDDILGDVEHLLDRGRDQLGAATMRARRTEPVDRIVRTADRARRTVGVGPAFPILGYEDLTVGQVVERLTGLTAPQLRKVRDYERRHANRKTVLEAIEKALS